MAPRLIRRARSWIARYVELVNLWWLVRGDLESCWARCVSVFASAGCVNGVGTGPELERGFEYQLAKKVALRFPESSNFIARSLDDRNPYVAAYSLIALLYMNPRIDGFLSAEHLLRTEVIIVNMTRGAMYETTLGKFFADRMRIARK